MPNPGAGARGGRCQARGRGRAREGGHRRQSVARGELSDPGDPRAEFTGAIPPAQIEQFLDGIVPFPADKLAAADDEASLRKALELDARNAVAARKLGRLLLEQGDTDEALELLDRFPGDFEAEGLAARARLLAELGEDRSDGAGTLVRAFAAWDEGDLEAALDGLQTVVGEVDDPERRDQLRRVMVAIFTELGADHPVAREHRRRLAAALT